jgi:nucleotide-binding universal stress UspA family protein
MDIDRLLESFGLTSNFTKADLDQAYKDLVQVWQPDKYANNPGLQHKAEEKLKEINSAYALLQKRFSSSNPEFDRQETSRGSARLKSIFHPTDFSEASEKAFSHAMKLALVARAKLSLLHVAPTEDDIDFSDFPEVRHTLERWRILPEGSSREDVFEKTGVFVEKIVAVRETPLRSILNFLEQHPTDLVVLATHQFNEPVRWLRKPVAEPIARESGEMTLFVPQGIEGFVSHRDGTVRLKRILIPIDHRPSPQRAIDVASALAGALGCMDCLFTLVHVGDPHDVPVVDVPTHAGWEWEKVVRDGDVVKEVLELEREHSVDLIVMTTQGHDGFLDALRGSTTERVLRGARCPLLGIPDLRKDQGSE